MDYTDFKPTYSYKYLALYELDLDTEEYWMPKLLQTRLKVKKLYSAINSTDLTGALDPLLMKIIDVEWNIGMWKLERNPISSQLSDFPYQSSNAVNDYRVIHKGTDRFIDGIPNELWDNEGFLVVLPSQETIAWLNMLADLWCVQQETEGV